MNGFGAARRSSKLQISVRRNAQTACTTRALRRCCSAAAPQQLQEDMDPKQSVVNDRSNLPFFAQLL